MAFTLTTNIQHTDSKTETRYIRLINNTSDNVSREMFKADRKIMYRAMQKSRDTRCLTTQGQYIYVKFVFLSFANTSATIIRQGVKVEERHFEQANKCKY